MANELGRHFLFYFDKYNSDISKKYKALKYVSIIILGLYSPMITVLFRLCSVQQKKNIYLHPINDYSAPYSRFGSHEDFCFQLLCLFYVQ